MVVLFGQLFAFAALGVFAILRHENRLFRDEKVRRLDRQLEFYGGVWSRLHMLNQMYIDFIVMEGYSYPEELSSMQEAIDTAPQSNISKRYRSFIKDSLGPLAIETVDIIINNFALLEPGTSLPLLLLEYFSLVNSYKVMMNRWESGDLSIHFSLRRFPPDILNNVEKEYMKLIQQKVILYGGKITEIENISYRPTFNPYYQTIRVRDLIKE